MDRARSKAGTGRKVGLMAEPEGYRGGGQLKHNCSPA